MRRFFSFGFLCLLFGFGTPTDHSGRTLGQDLAAAADPIAMAATPAIQTADWAVKWWLRRHEQKLAEKESLEKVDLLWVGDTFLKEDGTLPMSVMAERFHPGQNGYRMWAEALEPTVEEFFNE